MRPEDPGGIQAAVDAAADGDMILLAPGHYVEAVRLVERSVTVRGDGGADGVLVSGLDRPAFELLASHSTIEDLTVDGGGTVGDSINSGSIHVRGGAPTLRSLVIRGWYLVFERAAAGTVTGCRVEESGISIEEGATPEIRDNDVVGIWVFDPGTDPLIAGNRIHATEWQGMFVGNGARPVIEDNEIRSDGNWGIAVELDATRPTIRRNRIIASRGGVRIFRGAGPYLIGNEIAGSREVGIAVEDPGTEARIGRNRVHSGDGDGLRITAGASPDVRSNTVWANAGVGLDIRGQGSDPTLVQNLVHDNAGPGIAVASGASPSVRRNEIHSNGGASILVTDVGSRPWIEGNRLQDGPRGGVISQSGADPTDRDNTRWSPPGP